MSPTGRSALTLGALSLCALFVPIPLILVGGAVLAAVVAVDAWAVRARPAISATVPHMLSRGVPETLTLRPTSVGDRGVRFRQPAPPDIRIEPPEGDGELTAQVTALRRGRHVLPAPAARWDGPLRLGRWYHRPGESREVVVYPDLPAARKIALAVRRGRFGAQGRRTRGPLGLGTDFESIRDYLPDDDVRQVNWRVTARLGRPMSNQYRVEQDRDVVCVVDSGRLMAAPIGDLTRLDAAVDAATAVAFVADEVGDRCGVLAFDSEVRRNLRPRRGAGDAVVRALFDLEPVRTESDYELAFRTVAGVKRSFVLVLTDLLEESAARPLVEAVPILARRHVVVVAGVADPDLTVAVGQRPSSPHDVYAAAVALDVLAARSRVAARLRHAGAGVVEAPPGRLGAACTMAYLTAKARARL
ncbi:MAG: DUF58 domain-containing protein [Actinomycetota bacterium]